MANYIKLLQMTLLQELSSAINKRLSAEGKSLISTSADDVFRNLTYLYEEKKELEFAKETGRSYRFMPKKYKAMVMRLVAPNYCISTKMQSSDVGVTAEAYLFLTPESVKPVAQGKQFLSFDKAPEDLETEAERKAYIEATARGLAHSKAYQEFGIGSWYSYQYEPEDNPDSVINTMKEQDKLNPIMGYNSSLQNDNASDLELPQETLLSALPDDLNSLVPNPETNITPTPNTETAISGQDNPPEQEFSRHLPEVSDSATAISLDEAKNYPAPLGKAKSKGLTLWETAENFPTNIYWMYKQAELSEYDKAAIRTIAANSSKVYAVFQQHGETI